VIRGVFVIDAIAGSSDDRAMPTEPPRPIVFVVYPRFQVLDLAGPHEVFAGANQWAGRDVYELFVTSRGGGPVGTESGLVLDSVDLASVTARPDTLLVVGGNGVHDARRDEHLVHWIRHRADVSRRVGSVCSGAFLLGEAGLIDSRRVTTHWARAGRLAAEFPAADVDPEPIHIHDGVWTSAGVTAGIDLALALVEEDLGAECAQTIARWLVMFLRRPGGQSQFAAPVWERPAEHDGIRAAVDRIRRDPGADHSVRALAEVAAMSERNFTRVFSRELECSPGRYVERVRVDAARRLLESTERTTDSIARECGFGTGETMRRSFLRRTGVPPGAYRRRFTHTPRKAPT
jgi:transcriptional regulator GlxA family with amidase domain